MESHETESETKTSAQKETESLTEVTPVSSEPSNKIYFTNFFNNLETTKNKQVQLQGEVDILSKKLEALKTIYSQINPKFITQNETNLINSQIGFLFSQNTTLQLQSALTQLVEITKQISSLNEICTNIEIKINSEKSLRSQLIEANSFINSFSPAIFTSYFTLPDFTSQFSSTNDSFVLQSDISNLESRLKQLNSLIHSCSRAQPLTSLNTSIFTSIFRSSELQSNSQKSLYSESQQNVNELKLELRNTESLIKELQQNNFECQQKLQNYKFNLYKNEQSFAQKYNKSLQNFENEQFDLDTKILNLKKQLNESIKCTNEINSEIEKIIKYENENEFTEEEKSLEQNINKLKNEISELNAKYKNVKINEKRKIKKLKTEIIKLNKIYENNISKITYSDKERKISEMFSSIDESMKETFESENLI